MSWVSLTVDTNDGVIGAVSREHPEATFYVHAVGCFGDVEAKLIEVRGDGVDGAIECLKRHQATDKVDTGVRDRHWCAAYVESAEVSPYGLIEQTGGVVDTPSELVDGEATIRTVVRLEDPEELVRRLRAAGFPAEIEAVGTGLRLNEQLTAAQLRVVTAAVESGYYDCPRECTLTDLAEQLDIAKSTCSEILQRAESHILKQFCANSLSTAPPPTVVQ